MFGNFTEEARKILVVAKSEMKELKHPYVGSEHLLLAMLKGKNDISKKLEEYNLTYQILKDEIKRIIGVGNIISTWFLYTPLLKRILENAIIDSKENNHGEVTVEHLFSSLLEEGEGVAIRIMIGMGIDLDEIYGEFSYKINRPAKSKKNKKLLLEELGVDLTKKAREEKLDPVIGREKELKRVLSRRTKNNPLLIGEAGVGKTAIVEELSHRIALGDVPMALKNKRIISLDMATTVAGTKYRGEFEERIRKILKEIEENDDIILFIDEIHTLVGAGGAEGAIDASNIFKPALARGKLRCIGATTIKEYKKFMEEDSALERRFQKVHIEAPDKETVKDILMKLKSIYESYHYVTMSEELVDFIIDLSERYIYDRNQPDKAIDLMDEVCAKVSLKESKEYLKYHRLSKELQSVIETKNQAILNNEFQIASSWKEKENQLMDQLNRLELSLYQKNKTKIVTKKDVAEVLHIKTKIPIYEILKENKRVIEQLEKNIGQHILGQEKAVSETIQVAKRIKLGFKEEKRPYSMLYCGPSGVGKTELSKTFGKELVGEENIIRLDMSEYTEAHAVSKIVGAPPGYVGYKDHQNILEEIRNKPYSVLILDEIEKAHPAMINLLFQILDEGKMKDSNGVTVHFDHVVILMTSNIGFHEINIGFQSISQDIVLTRLKENFSVPFINRIDQIVIFDEMKEETMKKIVESQLDCLKRKYKKKGIHLKLGKDVISSIIELSEYREFGARRVAKIIKEKIENQMMDDILNNKKTIFISHLKEESVV